MHTTGILVCKDVNYGASKTSTTKDAALNEPANLKDGALGMTTMTNAGLTKLLSTAGVTETDYLLDADSANLYKNGTLDFFLGEATLFQRGTSMQLKGIKEVKIKAYTAPVKGVVVIGYAGSTYPSSSLYWPTTTLHQEARIKTFQQTDQNMVREPIIFYNADLIASETIYNGLRKLATVINADVYQRAAIILKSTETVLAIGDQFTGTGTLQIAVTNASAVVNYSSTTLTATTVAVGDTHIIYGRAYRVVSVGTVAANAVAITYDAPFEGATAAAAAATTSNATASATVTDGGIELTDVNFFSNYKAAVGGALQDADITYTVAPKKGSGHQTLVEQLEKDYIYYRNNGIPDDPDIRPKTPKSVSGTSYIIISIRFKNDTNDETVRTENDKELLLAMVSGSQQYTDVAAILTSLATNMGTFSVVTVA